MIRIPFLPPWFGFSDPGVEDALYENSTLRYFVKLAPNGVPDETTIGKFRGWLQKHDLGKVLLTLSKDHLEDA